MTRGELLITVFDEALKNLNFAVMMLKEQNYPTFEKCVEKSKGIFNYLSSVLDRNYEVSEQLYQLYSFIGQEIIRAEIKREEGILEPLIPLVEDMRQTWIEADKRTHMH